MNIELLRRNLIASREQTIGYYTCKHLDKCRKEEGIFIKMYWNIAEDVYGRERTGVSWEEIT